MNRAKILSDSSENIQEKTDNLTILQILLEKFCTVGNELSKFWFNIVILRVICYSLVITITCIGIHTWKKKDHWCQPNIKLKINDLRKHDKYNKTIITDAVAPKKNTIVVATEGNGIQKCRIDGGHLGFWKSYTQKSTKGKLGEDSIKNIHFDGNKLWFVGKRGSLSAADKYLHEWRLLYGANGFIPNINLSNETNCIEMSKDSSLIAFGTKKYGVGLYDVLTKQWYQIKDTLTSPFINCLLWKNNDLWVGTSMGLYCANIERVEDVINIALKTKRVLPHSLARKPVTSLIEENSPILYFIDNYMVHCIVGNGAYCVWNSFLNFKNTWKIIVDDADSLLFPLSGYRNVTTVLKGEDKSYFSIPKIGVVSYENQKRKLALENYGLPIDSASYCDVTVFKRIEDSNSEKPRLWSLASFPGTDERNIFYNIDGKWINAEINDKDVIGLAFSDSNPMCLSKDGIVRLYKCLNREMEKKRKTTFLQKITEKDRQKYFLEASTTFFTPAPNLNKIGATELGLKQLFVGLVKAESNIVCARYISDKRGWEPLFLNNRNEIKQFLFSDPYLWIVKENGELGYIKNISNKNYPEYVSVYGTSELLDSGKVISGDQFKDDFWFIYKTKNDLNNDSNYMLFSYNKMERTITNKNSILPNNIIPEKIRVANKYLYILGKEEVYNSFKGSVFKISAKEENGDFIYNDFNITDIVSADNCLMLITSEGSAVAQFPNENEVFIGKGSGQAIHKRIQPDQFGNIWCITFNEELIRYDSKLGQWSWQINGCTDLALLEEGSKSILFVAHGNLLLKYEINTDTTLLDTIKTLSQGQINKICFDNLTLGIECNSGRKKSIYTSKYPELNWACNWNSTTPEFMNPDILILDSILFVDFFGSELWIVDKKGNFYRYVTEDAEWLSCNLISSGLKRLIKGKYETLWFSDSSNNLFTISLSSPNRHNVVFKSQIYKNKVIEIINLTFYKILWILLLLLLLYVFIPTVNTIFDQFNMDIRKWKIVFNLNSFNFKWSRIYAPFSLIVFALIVLYVSLFILYFYPKQCMYNAFNSVDFQGKIQDYEILDNQLVVFVDNQYWYFKNIYRNPHPKKVTKNFPRVQNNKLHYPLFSKEKKYKLDNIENDLILSRKTKGGNFLQYHFNGKGFIEDQVNDFAISKNCLFLKSGAGILKYENKNDKCQLVDLYSVPEEKGALINNNSEIYFLSSTNKCYKYSDTVSGRWVSNNDIICVNKDICDIQWIKTYNSDYFLKNCFDTIQNKFFKDECLGIEKDILKRVWMKTPVGRREILTSDKNRIKIDKLENQTAKNKQCEDTFPISTNWNCIRTNMSPNKDSILFVFRNDIAISNPFLSCNKFPDEKISEITIYNDTLIAGTQFGIMYIKDNIPVKFASTGTIVTRLELLGDKILFVSNDSCQYYIKNQNYLYANDGENAFTQIKYKNLNLGKGINIAIAETISTEGVRKSSINLFDFETQKFNFDMVKEIFDGNEGFYIRTNESVQFVSLENQNVIGGWQYSMPDDIKGIIQPKINIIYAYNENGKIFELNKSNGWQNSDSKEIEKCLSGIFSDYITWKNIFNAEGRVVQFNVESEPIKFKNGKFISDWLTGICVGDKNIWTTTPVGVYTGSRINRDSPQKFVRISPEIQGDMSIKNSILAAENDSLLIWQVGNLLLILRDSILMQPEKHNIFRPQLCYGDSGWCITKYDSDRPFQIVSNVNDTIKQIYLNSSGNFHFDSVRSVAFDNKGVWVLHGAGLNGYSPNCIKDNHRVSFASINCPIFKLGNTSLEYNLEKGVWIKIDMDSFFVCCTIDSVTQKSIKLDYKMVFSFEKLISSKPRKESCIWSGTKNTDTIFVYMMNNSRSLKFTQNGIEQKTYSFEENLCNFIKLEPLSLAVTQKGLYLIEPFKKTDYKYNQIIHTKKELTSDSSKLYWSDYCNRFKDIPTTWSSLGWIQKQIGNHSNSINYMAVGSLVSRDSIQISMQENMGDPIQALCEAKITNTAFIGNLGSEAAKYGCFESAIKLYSYAFHLDTTDLTWKLQLDVVNSILELKKDNCNSEIWKKLAVCLELNSEISLGAAAYCIYSLLDNHNSQLAGNGLYILELMRKIYLDYFTWVYTYFKEVSKSKNYLFIKKKFILLHKALPHLPQSIFNLFAKTIKEAIHQDNFNITLWKDLKRTYEIQSKYNQAHAIDALISLLENSDNTVITYTTPVACGEVIRDVFENNTTLFLNQIYLKSKNTKNYFRCEFVSQIASYLNYKDFECELETDTLEEIFRRF